VLLFLSIIADIYPSSRKTSPNYHAQIIGTMKCHHLGNIQKEFITFFVDSGSSITTLLPFDVDRLGIDYESLDYADSPCTTATGERIFPKILPEVELTLTTYDGAGKKEDVFLLPTINCMKPSKELDKSLPVEVFTYSLLGMDVLHNFKDWHWDFDKGELHLKY
jgi:predicted aspartyl protease